MKKEKKEVKRGLVESAAARFYFILFKILFMKYIYFNVIIKVIVYWVRLKHLLRLNRN